MDDILIKLNNLFYNNNIFEYIILVISFIFISNFVKTRAIYEKNAMENGFKQSIIEALDMLDPNIEKECSISDRLKLEHNHSNRFFDKNFYQNISFIFYAIFFCFIASFFFNFYHSVIDFLIYYAIFVYFSIIVLVDHLTKYLPTEKLNQLLFFGLFLSLLNSFNDSHYSNFVIPLQDSVLGIIAGYLIPFSINLIFIFITKREVIGSGDFILLSALGSFFGLNNIILGLFISTFYNIIYILIKNKKMKINEEVPFGPALFFGVITAYFLNYYNVLDSLFT